MNRDEVEEIVAEAEDEVIEMVRSGNESLRDPEDVPFAMKSKILDRLVEIPGPTESKKVNSLSEFSRQGLIEAIDPEIPSQEAILAQALDDIGVPEHQELIEYIEDVDAAHQTKKSLIRQIKSFVDRRVKSSEK